MERLRNPYSGLGQYCLQLGRAFADEAAASGMGFVCLLPQARMGIFGENMRYRAVRPWHKIAPPSLGASLWHAMHQDSEFLPRNRRTPLVLTIHDLNFLGRADYSEAKKSRKLKQLQQKINKAAGLAYISEFVRDWVHQHLSVPAACLETVVHNGGSFPNGMPRPARSPVEQPFLFSIGIHPKKNYHVLMPILAANPEFCWVIAGPDSRGYRGKIEEEAQKWGVRERLSFCGPVDDDQKVAYYQHCTALLFPSLSEGFGLPVVEAMSLGKPVFLSALASLPEIGGSEAYYFTDFEPQALRERFRSGLEDFKNDPSKPERAMGWAARFNWRTAAGKYLQFYQKLLSKA